MALTRAQLLMGNIADGNILSGQPQGVRPGGTGIKINTDGVIEVDSQTIVGVMKMGQTTASAAGAYNGYTWPSSPGTAGQQLETNGAGLLTWADADGIDWTQKGQLIVGTGAGTDTLFNAGVNRSILVANSVTASGLEYTDTSQTSVILPSGTGAQRPLTPLIGDFRLNSGTGKLEFFTGAAWEQVASGNPLPGFNTFVKESIPVNPLEKGDAVIPAGTTGERQTAPTPIAGHFRYNTTLNQLEVFDGIAWQQIPSNSNYDFVLQTRVPGAFTPSAVIPPGNALQQQVGALPGYLRYNIDYDELECFNGTSWYRIGPSVGTVRSFVQGVAPTAVNTGDLWYNTLLERESVWDGAAWVQPGVSQTGPTGAAYLPVGSTGQQPAGVPGMIRYNNTINNIEYWDGANSTWGAPGGFSSGTTMLFANATAPLGWVQETGAQYNDAGLRIVNGAGGGGSGGTYAFSTVFNASYSWAGTFNITSGSVGATTLSIAQMPSHNHSYTLTNIISATPQFPGYVAGGGAQSYDAVTTGSQGGSGSHTHSLAGATGASTNTGDFALKYVNFIVATKS